MTDEQWLWLFANQSLDNDEKLESMCDNCRNEVTSKVMCTRCGKVISNNNNDNDDTQEETFVNESFDMEKYEAMKNGSYKPDITKSNDASNDMDGDVDIDLINQILNSSVGEDNG